MAFYTIRVNLSASEFPMLIANDGRSIISAGFDQNFVSIITAVTSLDKGIPQVIYMQNVLPTKEGFKSVHYDQIIPPPAIAVLTEVYQIKVSSSYGDILLAPGVSRYTNFVLDPNVSLVTWSVTSAFGSPPPTALVTTATVQGITYICYSKYGIYQYNTGALHLVPVTFTALVVANVVAICEANGYLIAVTETAVAWGAVTNPTDFTPSLITGAGGGLLQEAVGKILMVAKVAGGFIVYCEGNMVAEQFTANGNYPFIATAIEGSAGLGNTGYNLFNPGDAIAFGDNLGFHFAWTTNGLMQVTLNQAKLILSGVTDFIASNLIETFDWNTNIFTVTQLNLDLCVELKVIGERYLVISYGTANNTYTHAIIYDFILLRLGKLAINHCCVFEINNVDFGDNGQINQQMAFVNSTTGISILNPNEATGFLGVLLLGKFQFQRTSMMVFLGAEVEVKQSFTNPSMELWVYPTNDGKTFLPAQKIINQESATNIQIYSGKITGKNISLMIKGNFDVTSVVLNFTTGGTR